MNEKYEGYENYMDYTRAVFQEGRDAATDLLLQTTDIKFKPTVAESGYFMPVDIKGNEHLIPEKYFIPNKNYEKDENTLVKQQPFPETWDKVPLDFALCRYLAVEKGISLLPMTCFMMQESQHRLEHYIRVRICSPAEAFTNPEIVKRIQNL